MYEGKLGPHWDYQLLLSSFMNNGIAIFPNTNLVSNIGFGEDSTHLKTKGYNQGMKLSPIKFPLDHPTFMCRNVVHDDFVEKKEYSRDLIIRLKRKIKSYLPEKIVKPLKSKR